MGSVSSHSGVWGEAPAANDFSAFSAWKNDAGGIYLYFRKLRNVLLYCWKMYLDKGEPNREAVVVNLSKTLNYCV